MAEKVEILTPSPSLLFKPWSIYLILLFSLSYSWIYERLTRKVLCKKNWIFLFFFFFFFFFFFLEVWTKCLVQKQENIGKIIMVSQNIYNILVTWSTIQQLWILLPRLWRWPTKLDWEISSSQVIPTRFSSMTWSMASESTILGLPDFALSLRLLQLMWNVLNHLITVLWSTVSTTFTQQIVLVSCTALWLSSNIVKQKFLN